MGTYKDASYYNKVYNSGGAGKHYRLPIKESKYYDMWIKVRNMLEEIKHPKVMSRNYIIELGCGVGQFCEMLHGAYPYLGMDFSERAIEFAQTKKIGRFMVRDIETQSIGGAYEVVICLETLEHLQDDIAVLAKIKSGTHVICSVPDFDYESHVRFFRKSDDVVTRYEGEITIEKIIKLQHWFIFKGVKK